MIINFALSGWLLAHFRGQIIMGKSKFRNYDWKTEMISQNVKHRWFILISINAWVNMFHCYCSQVGRFSLRTRCDTNVKLDTSMLPRNLILLTILEMQEGLYHSPKIHFLFHEKDSKRPEYYDIIIRFLSKERLPTLSNYHISCGLKITKTTVFAIICNVLTAFVLCLPLLFNFMHDCRQKAFIETQRQWTLAL